MTPSNPQPPSTDISDPKVLAGARRVATRKNNDARRKLAKERAALPLFAPQIPAEPAHLVTPEEVIEKRKLYQIAAWENGVERDVQKVADTIRLRNEVWALVPVDEYLEYFDKWLVSWIPDYAYWGLVLDSIKRRAEPMTEVGDWLLNILSEWEGEPPTHHDLHYRCGDGRSIKEIGDGLLWLEARRYVRGGVLRPCRFVEAKYGGNATPWMITDAGRRYVNKDE